MQQCKYLLQLFSLEASRPLEEDKQQTRQSYCGKLVSSLFGCRIHPTPLSLNIGTHSGTESAMSFQELCPSRNMALPSKVMQWCINDLSEYMLVRGFKFSAEKTTFIDFYHTTKHCLLSQIPLNSLELHFHYLRVTRDSKFLWNIHVNNLKMTCIQVLNILKEINNRCDGADWRMLLELY